MPSALTPEPIASSSRLQPPPSPRRPLLPELPLTPSSPSFMPPTHPGCVLCGLVASAASQSRSSIDSTSGSGSGTPRAGSPSLSPRAGSFSGTLPGMGRIVRIGEREIVYRDQDITVFPAIGKERLCSDGRHLIVVMNQHVESVYQLGPSDIPLLSHMLDTARQFLSNLPSMSGDTERAKRPEVRVGFVGPIMRDPQCPHAHLHAHAMLGPIDKSLPGAGMWRRNVVYGPLNWWSIEDLRAEIRESTSNNRVKSGYEDRHKTPLDKVPDAGSVSGPANALDPEQYTDASRPVTPTPTSIQMAGGSSSSNATPTAPDRGKGKAVEVDDGGYEDLDLGVRQ